MRKSTKRKIIEIPTSKSNVPKSQYNHSKPQYVNLKSKTNYTNPEEEIHHTVQQFQKLKEHFLQAERLISEQFNNILRRQNELRNRLDSDYL